ncbi:MAG: ABC transporter ATP-binding protein [Acidimicrobiales bacterium]
MSKLELVDISKRFGAVEALRGLSLEVASGEFLSLLGPSGCGKTTALRIIAGFEHPDVGKLLVDGRDLTAIPANRRSMGMVFQSYSLFPNMTARENVEFGLRIRRRARAERTARALELLDLVGLAGTANRYPHQLSGGQQQRVALARALAIEPEVLLLDEPLSALDAKVRVQLREEIRRIQTSLGITTIYVTHDQEEALSISDRVAVLSLGCIEQIGAPSDIYREPRTRFVAEFVGTMNRLDGKVNPDGSIECGGLCVAHGVALGEHAPGEQVIVLVRPESIVLEELPEPQAASGDLFEGRIVAHTFLGAVTRVTVSVAFGAVTADLPSSRALGLSPGTRVSVRIDPSGVRLLSIGTSGPGSDGSGPTGEAESPGEAGSATAGGLPTRSAASL